MWAWNWSCARGRGSAAVLGTVIAIACGAGLVSCGSGAGPTVRVAIIGNPLGEPDSLYRPANITVRVGATVTWLDKDDAEHTVTPDLDYPGWSGGSSILRHGQAYTYTFNKVGAYEYHCMVHANMLGTVTVLAAEPGGG